MDAGLAAVIAGAAGAGGAALAALATSLGLLRQARIQGDQAHQLWLNNHRQQAFEEFLIAADAVEEASKEVLRAVEEDQSRHPEFGRQSTLDLVTDAGVVNRSLRLAANRAVLLGNDETERRALLLWQRTLVVADLSMSVAREVMSPEAANSSPSPSSDLLRQAQVDVHRERAAFIAHARKALRNT